MAGTKMPPGSDGDLKAWRSTHIRTNTGSSIPFARTKAERLASGDPRPSLEERYGTHETYVAKVRAAAERLVRGRYLLKDDAERLIAQAEASKVLK